MVFSSIFFIFCFLPIFMLIYYLVPGKGKDIVLIIGSLLFYAWGEPIYVILLVFSAVFNYYMGLELNDCPEESRRLNMIFTVVVNLFILGFFKYYAFLLDSIGSVFRITLSHPELSLPIGISFYTFKNLSYILDVYNDKIDPEPNFLTFCVYSMMFPHMAAGPIVRYADIEHQLYRHPVSIPKFGVGAEYFIKGLAKKVILADNLAVIYAAISSRSSNAVLTAWIGIFAYTMQIYFDFSGYSDMAIGLGKMLGFGFLKNFDYPYLSESVAEFWRRWHISLGSWFRDYIYIPLGGNRVSVGKHIRNILVVWALTGLWHGAAWNFVLWGVYYGLLLLLEKFALGNVLDSAPAFVRRIYTMFCVMIGWVFFSQTSFPGIAKYLGTMFGPAASGFADTATFYYFRTGIVLFVICIIACRPNLQNQFKKLMKRNMAVAIAIDVILLALATAFMVYNSYSPFLYQQF